MLSQPCAFIGFIHVCPAFIIQRFVILSSVLAKLYRASQNHLRRSHQASITTNALAAMQSMQRWSAVAMQSYIASPSFLDAVLRVVEKLRQYNPDLIYGEHHSSRQPAICVYNIRFWQASFVSDGSPSRPHPALSSRTFPDAPFSGVCSDFVAVKYIEYTISQ
eukprot:scaffold3726_cov21-Prasinocladus_malaysianus.AAC.1